MYSPDQQINVPCWLQVYRSESVANYCNAVFQPSERYNILRSTAQGPQACPIQLQALGLEAWQSLHTNHMAY